MHCSILENMKRKSPLSENATKGDLLILKRDLGNKLNDLEQKLDNKAQGYRDEVLTKLDDIAGQLGNLREENIIGTHQTSTLNDRADNHETRIKNLERTQHIA